MTHLVSVWKNTFAVGIQEIDEEHQQLFECLDTIMLSLNTPASKAQAAEALERLDLYTRTHFRVEEALMRLFDYPDIDAHKREHAAFVAKLAELRARIVDEDVSKAIAAFLTNWLVEHIKRADTAYVAYFRERSKLALLSKAG